ncbi:hypothetical protein ACNO7M_02880 [Bisgaard Taxon 45]
MIKTKKNNTLKIKRGDTFVHRFSLFSESAGEKIPFDLSDVDRIDLQAIADDEIVLSLSTTDSTLILKDNYLLMLVSKKLTQGKTWEDGEYDIQVTYNDNVTKTIASGKIKLEHDVTESKVTADETSFERAIEFAMQHQASEIIVNQDSISLVFGIAVKGDKGEDGKSAYQLWLDQGNHGSEQDFINSLKGRKGNDGEHGNNGSDGATFMPSVSETGELSWSNNKGLPNPETINIKGPPGDVGDISNLISQIEQLSEKNKDLETRVAKLEAKFGTHDRAIGRNYIINSEHYDRFKNNNSSLYELNTGKDGKGNWISGSSKGQYQISTYGELLNSFQYFSEDLSNQTITTSVDVMATYDCDIRLDNGQNTRLKANQWVRISVTTSGSRMPGIYVNNVNATVGSGSEFRLYHKKWKLEKGSIATDWIPA